MRGVGCGDSERRAVWRWWQVGVAVRSAEREHAARCTPQDPSSRDEEKEELEEEEEEEEEEEKGE
jgi:hypothetical protein